MKMRSDTVSLARYETGDESGGERMKQVEVAFHKQWFGHMVAVSRMVVSSKWGTGGQSCSGKYKCIELGGKVVLGVELGTTER
jgi:hypothetical protein